MSSAAGCVLCFDDLMWRWRRRHMSSAAHVQDHSLSIGVGARSSIAHAAIRTVQVEEMAKAVDVAEKNSARFGLTQAEIASRRKWILQTTREVRS